MATPEKKTLDVPKKKPSTALAILEKKPSKAVAVPEKIVATRIRREPTRIREEVRTTRTVRSSNTYDIECLIM